MTGFLLALCFASGVALIWLGAAQRARAPKLDAGLRRLLGEAGLPLRPAAFAALLAASALLAGALALSLTALAALALLAALGGAYAPYAWARRRRERLKHERERAWPAALAQLADALEAGIAFPAAVALCAQSGPSALRGELRAFHARDRAGGLGAALDGLAAAGERSADTVALVLRAGLLDLPAGGLAPVLRELAGALAERFEARERARSRAQTLQLEAAVLALSPIALVLLVGLASPGYLDAYRTPAGTLVSLLAGALIFGCYLAMRRLGRVPEPRRTAGAS